MNAFTILKFGVWYQKEGFNDEKAVELFRDSSEQGNPIGQFYFGDCYRTGTGVEMNNEIAAEFFQ